MNDKYILHLTAVIDGSGGDRARWLLQCMIMNIKWKRGSIK